MAIRTVTLAVCERDGAKCEYDRKADDELPPGWGRAVVTQANLVDDDTTRFTSPAVIADKLLCQACLRIVGGALTVQRRPRKKTAEAGPAGEAPPAKKRGKG